MFVDLVSGVGGGFGYKGDVFLFFYYFYELNYVVMVLVWVMVDMMWFYFQNLFNLMMYISFGCQIVVGCEVLEWMMWWYGKFEFGLFEILVGGVWVLVWENIVWS